MSPLPSAPQPQAARSRGRPLGSPNIRETAELQPSRCPSCSSTRRDKYLDRLVQQTSGLHDGRHYTHIVRRRTRCADCGQLRIDRSCEYWPDGDPGDQSEAAPPPWDGK